MNTAVEIALFPGQGWTQIGELTLALLLSALIGLERNLHGKGAGLRTQSIVGVSSALFFLVSKYGFFDVLRTGVVLDPSRVAAQIVSGIGFLGAGLIITQRSRVRGLTTAASVWETAAIGMAAAAGLWLLSLLVTAFHFLITYGFSALERRLPAGRFNPVAVEVRYDDGCGLLRTILSEITTSGWSIQRAAPGSRAAHGLAVVDLDLTGPGDIDALLSLLADTAGVRAVERLDEDSE